MRARGPKLLRTGPHNASYNGCADVSEDLRRTSIDRTMDDNTRRRALAGDLGPEAQRLALSEIASAMPRSPSLLTSRQKFVAIAIAALLIGSVIALAALELALPASLARRATGS